MKEITILSGKGGTGKTSISAGLASVVKDAVFCDSDVDAADLHLVLKPEVLEENRFFSGWTAAVNSQCCSLCGICVETCRFGAIHVNQSGEPTINSYQCEGCRLCERICPEKAITSTQNNNNFWYVSTTRFGPLVHAKMGAGEENSGKLVAQVRKRAREIASETGAKYIINDGPPGIGCATISSLTGSNAVLLVTEPSKSGLHDAIRLVELIRTFKLPVFVVINKSDINPEVADIISEYFDSENIPLLAKIPFDREMVEAMINEKTIVEYNRDSIISKSLKSIMQKIENNE